MASNDCCTLPGWLQCRSNAERDEDEESFHSATCVDAIDSVVRTVPSSLAAVAPDDGGDTDDWKAQFCGLWRLELHRDDYDHWLALKVTSGLKRRIAASLPATKRFVMDESRDRVTHVYTLASSLELTQYWRMADAEDWREETEAGLKCLVSSSWGPRVLIIRKQFPSLGLIEQVENTVSADGKHLTATMCTTVVATGETRSTSDRFRRVDR